MTSIKLKAQEIEKALEQFSPVTLEYGKDMVVGFPNPENGSDLIIHIKKDEIIMSFGFQNAHFAFDDVNSLKIHTEKYLTGEYSSVEFFVGDKDLFGGSRLSSTVDFSTVEGIVKCYACGIERAENGLYQLFREQPEVVVRAVSFDNKINKVSNVKYVDGKYVVKVVR